MKERVQKNCVFIYTRVSIIIPSGFLHIEHQKYIVNVAIVFPIHVHCLRNVFVKVRNQTTTRRKCFRRSETKYELRDKIGFIYVLGRVTSLAENYNQILPYFVSK